MTLHRAAYFGLAKNLEKLLEAKVSVDALDAESGNSALILAARNGQLPAVQTLIERGKANPNLPGFGGLTALHHACKNDHLEVVTYLVDHAKANVNVEDEAGNTPVALAARMGNLKCLEAIATKGANLDQPNKRGTTPFISSVVNGRMAIVDALLKKPININHADKDGNTALHYAARSDTEQSRHVHNEYRVRFRVSHSSCSSIPYHLLPPSCGYIRVVGQLLAANVHATSLNNAEESPETVALNDAIRVAIKAATN